MRIIKVVSVMNPSAFRYIRTIVFALFVPYKFIMQRDSVKVNIWRSSIEE